MSRGFMGSGLALVKVDSVPNTDSPTTGLTQVYTFSDAYGPHPWLKCINTSDYAVNVLFDSDASGSGEPQVTETIAHDQIPANSWCYVYKAGYSRMRYRGIDGAGSLTAVAGDFLQ